MRGSELQVAPLREKAQRLFGGRPEVRIWEIGLMRRARHVGDGACARITWMRTEPARIQELVDVVRADVLPRVEALPGFSSASLLVDRASGTGALAATYESREALERSRDAASGLREETLGRTSSELVDVVEMEVALAHLRVPETV